jgi:excisionase family DNA binding protein
MVIVEQKGTFFTFLNKLRLNCFTQYPAILNVIGEILKLTNVEPAMTVRGIAEFLNVDAKTIYRLAQRGDLPGFKVSESWRFWRPDQEAWVADRKGQATSGKRT